MMIMVQSSGRLKAVDARHGPAKHLVHTLIAFAYVRLDSTLIGDYRMGLFRVMPLKRVLQVFE
tara:strand:- start:888917 stop:889105 length:189 start_codon:yes stop_codon:yes gene_type:complete